MSSNAKRIWWILPAVLFLVAALALLPNFSKKIPLLSPLGISHRPDLSSQLKGHVNQMGQLDYSHASQLTTISDKISYLVYNPLTLKVYAAKGQNDLRSPGSFTKLLTAQVALDLFPDNQLFTVNSSDTQKEPTILGLKAGEQLTLGELLRGAISTSANDAASVLGRGTTDYYRQDISFFPELMNQKAQLLNLTSSHFANPEGYDDANQYTTLVDIAKLVNNVEANYPSIVAAGAADRIDLTATSTHGFYYLPNWNGLLGIYPGVNGLKIAYTGSSGYSTIVTAKRQNVLIVAIVADANSIRERDLATATLLDETYMQEHLTPVKIRASQLNLRYTTWAKLAAQIRAELKLLDSTPSAIIKP